MKKNKIIGGWRIAAVSASALLAAASTKISPPAHLVESPNIGQLQQILSAQLVRNELPLPQIIALNGKEPGFFGWMTRTSVALNNILGQPDSSEGFTNDQGIQSIIGVSPDGAVAKSLSEDTYEKNHPNYLASHFGPFQEAVGIHETVHYVDGKLGLSKAIYADTLKTLHIDKTIPLLTAGPPGGSLLESNLRERIADAGMTLYRLSNNKDGETSKAFMDWRDTNMESTHYTASSIQAAIEAYRQDPKPGMDVVETTKRAAIIVKNQIAQIVREQQAVIAAGASRLQMHTPPGIGNVDAVEEREIISRAQIGHQNLHSDSRRALRSTFILKL